MGSEYVLAIGYLLGSIPFAWLIGRHWSHVDLRSVGSGNVGAANVLRIGSRKLAVVAAVLDALKGAAAVLVARRATENEHVVVLTGLAAIVGHVFPIWLRFRGGKGVATTAGVFAALAPRAMTTAGAVFAVTLWKTGYASVASIAATLTLMLMVLILGLPGPVTIGALAASTLVLARHSRNVQRLLAGNELPLARRRPPVNR